jgi:hypothetical protein
LFFDICGAGVLGPLRVLLRQPASPGYLRAMVLR